MTETDEIRFGILNFGHCILFEVCDLEFVILNGGGAETLGPDLTLQESGR